MAQYTVQAPDGKVITLEGPDGASQEDVIQQAQKLYQPPAAADPGIMRGIVEAVNPMPMLRSLYGFTQAVNPLASRQDRVQGAAEAMKFGLGNLQEGKRAIQAARGEGEFSEMTGVERASSAFGHGLAAALPGIGPAAAQAGENFVSGRPREATGETIGLIGQFLVPGLLRPYRNRTARFGGVTNSNPRVAEAVQFGLDNGIPVDAGTATGNAAVKAAQHLADRSIGGGILNPGERQAAANAFAETGKKLAGRVSASPVVPEQAGRAIQKDIESASIAAAERATAAYHALENIENDPANIKEVQVGTRSNPSADPSLPNRIPVTEQIALPVDMRGVKDALRPVESELSQRMPLAQQQASPALQAIRNILNRPDAIAASVADKDLSYLKSIQRGPFADQVKHYAGKAIQELDGAVQTAVAGAGPDAVKALDAGRAATIEKYAARDVLENLRDEPVQAFNQTVWRNDAGIQQLRAIKKYAPNQMRTIGRAYLDNLLGKASAEGEFGRTQGIWSEWQNLGPETKNIIFQDPHLVKNLDNFFLLAKKMSESPNPSGTGHLVSMVSQGGLLVTHPAIGVPVELGAAAMSKLMHNPAAVKLLVDGMQIPIGKGAYAGSIAGRILTLAGATVPKTDEASKQGATTVR